MPTDEEKLPGFDTDPPPDGEDDPYAAPTRVAPMAPQLIEELMNTQAEKARAEKAAAEKPPAEKAGAVTARTEKAGAVTARTETAGAVTARTETVANDSSELAAAASHVVPPPRPKPALPKPPRPADARPPAPPKPLASAPPKPLASAPPKPLEPPAPPAPPASLFGAPPAPEGPIAIDPVLPTNPSPSEPAQLPYVHDGAAFAETPSASGEPPRSQSGRTVPLSAALLASVVRSVDDKQAAAAAAAAVAPRPALVETLFRERSVLALAMILAVGLGVFITGVVMFLDALNK